MSLVPELYCTNLETTLAFYTQVLGFEIKYARHEEGFVYLTRDEIELMFEQLDGTGRRWRTADLEPPLGRGVNFQCEIPDVQALYEAVQRACPDRVYLPMERATYRCGAQDVTQDQFIVQDPDGYLFRFCREV